MTSPITDTMRPSFMGGSAPKAAPLTLNTVIIPEQKKSSKADSLGNRVRSGIKEGSRLQCPHCNHPALIRSSTKITVLTKESLHYCTNPECGHTFVALTEIVRTLSPSATPDPSVHLPLSSHVRRDLMRATLDHAGQADHQTQFTQPVNGDLFSGLVPPPP